jgi:hypothetical protein
MGKQGGENSDSYEVGLLTYKIVGWMCIRSFSCCSIAAFWAGQFGPIVVFAFFVAMGIYIVPAAGEFTFDPDGLTHRTVFGTNRMCWKEVKHIEIGAADGTFVFHGDTKRFVLAPASAWSGSPKPSAYSFLVQKIDSLQIVPYPSKVAAYKVHKNVRVQV